MEEVRRRRWVEEEARWAAWWRWVEEERTRRAIEEAIALAAANRWLRREWEEAGMRVEERMRMRAEDRVVEEAEVGVEARGGGEWWWCCWRRR